MKFKKGDKVKVVGDFGNYTGKVFIIHSVCPAENRYMTKKEDDEKAGMYYWYENELELVKPKFNHEDYAFGRVVIHCRTEEACNIFLQYMKEHGEDRYCKTVWERTKELTCYNLNMPVHADLVWYKNNGYTVLEFDDFDWSDFEMKKFTKAYLKNGDVVKRRSGDVEILVSDLNVFIGNDGNYGEISCINDDLTSTVCSKRDIIAVRRINCICGNPFDAFKFEKGDLIFERKEVEEMTLEEVCKALGKEIKIVKEK